MIFRCMLGGSQTLLDGMITGKHEKIPDFHLPFSLFSMFFLFSTMPCLVSDFYVYPLP